MIDLLIKNALVVTCHPDVLTGEIHSPGAIAVQEGRVLEIGPSAELETKYAAAEKVIDGTGRVAMPGFVITHTHMPYVLGHNQPVDVSQLRSFWDMLQKMGWEWLEDITTADGILAGTQYASLKMLKSGTTTVCDLVEAPNALPGPLDASVRAIAETGIRAQIGYEVTERIPGVPIAERLDPSYAERGFEENLRLIDSLHSSGGENGRIQGRLGVHTAYTNSPATLARARDIADQCQCGIQIHVAEIPRAFLCEKYGKSAPEVLEEAGLLGPDVVAAHCIDLTDSDIDILARHGVHVAHTPMTNSLGGNGVARVPDMMEKGINVSLGHDCFFTLDTAEYIRYGYLVHKAHRANPMLIPPFQALDLALGNAATALGLGEEIGSLHEGKRADILLIKPDAPSPVTPSTVVPYFTMTFRGCEVQTVVVDGEVVVEDGASTRVDESLVRKACVEQAAALWKRNGIEIRAESINL
ncbi:MAG: amidohydrolase family protein [Candidatus Bipolaricaulota bacterium]|nr:MAG: amidohydrolase family protein [Candidatus Bipolaricaulota bacterium]